MEHMVNRIEPDNGQDGTIGLNDSRGGLSDRGIGFQAAGFALVWLGSTAILELFEGSGFWLYQWFERATVDTYWAALIPLGAFFDWVRKMFERGKAIREAKKAEIEEKARQLGLERGLAQGMEQGISQGIAQGMEQGISQGIAQGMEQGIAQGMEQGMDQGRQQGRQEATEQFRALLTQHGITLPPEVDSAMFGGSTDNGS